MYGATVLQCLWMQRLTSLFISYWQSRRVCRGDSKEKVDINLNSKRWHCSLRSRSSPMYRFHVLRCRARVCVRVCLFYKGHGKDDRPRQPPPPLPPHHPLPNDAVSLHSKGRTVNIMKPREDQSFNHRAPPSSSKKKKIHTEICISTEDLDAVCAYVKRM